MLTHGEPRTEPSAELLTAARAYLAPIRQALGTEFIAAYLTGNARIYGLVEQRATLRKAQLVSAVALKRILNHAGNGVRAKRYANVAAAGKASGVQVCNVVLRKRKGASPTRFWNAVGAVRKACRG